MKNNTLLQSLRKQMSNQIAFIPAVNNTLPPVNVCLRLSFKVLMSVITHLLSRHFRSKKHFEFSQGLFHTV